jgi:hypothetical protein
MGALVIEPSTETPPAAIVSREMQQLWFSLAAQSWSSLLIVPAPGVSSGLAIANGLLQIARRSNPEWRCSLIDATHVSLDGLSDMVHAIARMGARERVIAVVDRLDDNPAAMGIASCCDAALLCVALDGSDLASSRRTLERCGRPRFIGSVVVVPDKRR